MLWMETYLLYCSVRLGVMVICILAFISTLVPSLLFFCFGLDLLNPILKIFNDDDHFKTHRLVKIFTNMVDNDSDKLLVIFQVYLFTHMTSSIVAFYGAWKMVSVNKYAFETINLCFSGFEIKKFLLIPLSLLELSRVIYCLVSHVLLMTVCKNKLNLGLLITATLGGGFVILYLGYNWATVVSLYQIITLINSKRYRTVYGNDPFHPLITKINNPIMTESVQVPVTPKNRDVSKPKNRKLWNILFKKANSVKQQTPIISVAPLNSDQNNSKKNENSKKWTKWISTPQKPLIDNNATVAENDAYDSSYLANYSYWQWSELAPAISVRNRQNLYGYNGKY